jgi:hypothetical protein
MRLRSSVSVAIGMWSASSIQSTGLTLRSLMTSTSALMVSMLERRGITRRTWAK